MKIRVLSLMAALALAGVACTEVVVPGSEPADAVEPAEAGASDANPAPPPDGGGRGDAKADAAPDSATADATIEPTQDAGADATTDPDATTGLDATADADATVDAADATSADAADATADAADAAGPCTSTSPSFPGCAGGTRRVFAVTCVTRQFRCGTPDVITNSTLDVVVDLYPTIVSQFPNYPTMPAATGAPISSPNYRFIVGQGGGPTVRTTGSLDGISQTAVAPGAGYNEYHRYSVNRGAMTFSSTSHYQSHGPCGATGYVGTDKTCTGTLKP